MIAQLHPTEIISFLRRISEEEFNSYRVLLINQLSLRLIDSYDFYEHYRLYCHEEKFLKELVASMIENRTTLPAFIYSYYELINNDMPLEERQAILAANYLNSTQLHMVCKSKEDALLIINTPIFTLHRWHKAKDYKINILHTLQPLLVDFLITLDDWLDLINRSNICYFEFLCPWIYQQLLPLITDSEALTKTCHVFRFKKIDFLKETNLSSEQQREVFFEQKKPLKVDNQYGYFVEKNRKLQANSEEYSQSSNCALSP